MPAALLDTALTCYYYSLLLAYALLWREDDLTGAGLAVLSARTGVISALTTWNDVRYTAMSVVLVVHRDRVLSVASATVILTRCSNEKTARP